MAIDRWFIGGGAEHSPESARRALYASTGGAEGVGGPNDLKVVPLETPGQGVRVQIGSALIKSNYVGGETQTYMGTVYQQEYVDTTPTGSAVGRSDMVIMRVEDPFAAGSPYTAPAEGDIPLAPYIYIRVISGVPNTAKRIQDVPGHANDTAVTLARIDFPASTGTVTSGMIKDMRELAQPRRSEVVFARPRITGDDTNQRYLSGTYANGGEIFPGGAGSPNEFVVEIPTWATHMIIDARWMVVQYSESKDPWGAYWIEFGDEYRNHTWPEKRQYEFATQHFDFNSPYTQDTRSSDWLLMDTQTIPAKLRGKKVTFAFKAGLKNSPGGTAVWMDATGGLGCRITFSEELQAPFVL